MKSKNSIILLFFLCLSISGCGYPQESHILKTTFTSTATSLKTTPTRKLSDTPPHKSTSPNISTITTTSTSTRSPFPTETVTPIPAISPTFDVASVGTHTPVPPAQCPVEKPELIPNFDFDTTSFTETIGKQIRDFLNAGGTRQSVITVYRQYFSKADDKIIRETDVTGDGVPELLFADSDGSFNIYNCEQGQYKELGWQTYHYTQPAIIGTIDMNLDNVDEIITIEGDARIRIVHVFGWDGQNFQMLNDDPTLTYQQPCSSLLGSSWAYTQDIDGNGTLELILEQAIPIWTEYIDGFPWREEKRICSWNGKFFELSSTEIVTTPEYRFQAIQDGDRATLAGEHDKAIGFYQQAIFSDTLKWWSADRRQYELNIYEQQDVKNPTPIPSLLPDPAEYPNLAAYAYFRILLLHTVRGFLPEAQTVYETLQEKFPQGQIGHAYAELAAAFWDEYYLSQSTDQACGKAIEYTTLRPGDILSYIGNGEYAITYFGKQSLEYKPDYICPFR